MTSFVLVSGGFTGGWVWQEVAEELRAHGARAYPATLTGLGDRRHLAHRDTNLGTHIEDLVQLIDHIEEPELVLVGHCYGIHPVLGAADNRPERLSRIVYVDAPMPVDGVSVFDQTPCEVRDRLREAAQRSKDRLIAPPPVQDRSVWGSTDGIGERELARLTRLAAPQPLGTYTQPLRLSGAFTQVSTSGVLCTAGGLSISMVESLVATGGPRFDVLTDPRVGFFELETGHWPMLSQPAELTQVLLRAAAGEGYRLRSSG
ncbi:alpha/beta fold hydrolase [Streptomyces sp. NPDC006879]|uniref:alpha/beta fold hydrolase n=1 Tax=Streptomyces sp. NPDC006879 TaxID=3364767 RepID=UPI0036B99DCB